MSTISTTPFTSPTSTVYRRKTSVPITSSFSISNIATLPTQHNDNTTQRRPDFNESETNSFPSDATDTIQNSTEIYNEDDDNDVVPNEKRSESENVSIRVPQETDHRAGLPNDQSKRVLSRAHSLNSNDDRLKEIASASPTQSVITHTFRPRPKETIQSEFRSNRPSKQIVTHEVNANLAEGESRRATLTGSLRNPSRGIDISSGNVVAVTDSSVYRLSVQTIPTVNVEQELKTGTTSAPIRITLESALNFGYSNRKQLRNPTLETEKKPGILESDRSDNSLTDSRVIRTFAADSIYTRHGLEDDKGNTSSRTAFNINRLQSSGVASPFQINSNPFVTNAMMTNFVPESTTSTSSTSYSLETSSSEADETTNVTPGDEFTMSTSMLELDTAPTIPRQANDGTPEPIPNRGRTRRPSRRRPVTVPSLIGESQNVRTPNQGPTFNRFNLTTRTESIYQKPISGRNSSIALGSNTSATSLAINNESTSESLIADIQTGQTPSYRSRTRITTTVAGEVTNSSDETPSRHRFGLIRQRVSDSSVTESSIIRISQPRPRNRLVFSRTSSTNPSYSENTTPLPENDGLLGGESNETPTSGRSRYKFQRLSTSSPPFGSRETIDPRVRTDENIQNGSTQRIATNRFKNFRSRKTPEYSVIEESVPDRQRIGGLQNPQSVRTRAQSERGSSTSDYYETNGEIETTIRAPSSRIPQFTSTTPTSPAGKSNDSPPVRTRKRIVKRPRLRTTESAIVDESSSYSATDYSTATSRMRRPYSAFRSTTREAINTSGDVVLTNAAKNIEPSGRNNVGEDKLPTFEDEVSSYEVSTTTNTVRRKLVRKRPFQIVSGAAESLTVEKEVITTLPDTASDKPTQRFRKVIRKLRPKSTTTPSYNEIATTTDEGFNEETFVRFSDVAASHGPTTEQGNGRHTTIRRGKAKNILEDVKMDLNESEESLLQPAADTEETISPSTVANPSRFTIRPRVQYSPKRPIIGPTTATTKAIVRASPSPRNRYSSRVGSSRNTGTKVFGGSETGVDIQSNVRPLSFIPNRSRVVGSRFRNTYKGISSDNELRTVLKPSVDNDAFEEVSEKSETADSFDDNQYVDDNYESVTEPTDGIKRQQNEKKVVNVPVDVRRRPQQQTFGSNNRSRSNSYVLNGTAGSRQANVPFRNSDKKIPFGSGVSPKANTPALLAVSDHNSIDNNTTTTNTISTTPMTTTTNDYMFTTVADESDFNSTRDPVDDTHTTPDNIEQDNNGTFVDLQEYYAKGGNGTPTQGPLASLILNNFKSKKLPTTTTKPTTLHHVFAIDYDEVGKKSEQQNKTQNESVEEISKKLEKLVEVNRIVEIYSKKGGGGENVSRTSGEFVVERIPTVDKVGEISRLTLVNVKKNSDQKRREAKAQQFLSPETVFGVETSTIALEGLFEKDRRAKELVVKMETDVNNNTINVVYARTITEKEYQSSVLSTTPLTTSSTTTARSVDTKSVNRQNTDVVRPLVPMLRPETNELTPLVISIANLDQVILTKVAVAPSTMRPDAEETTLVGSESDVPSATDTGSDHEN